MVAVKDKGWLDPGETGGRVGRIALKYWCAGFYSADTHPSTLTFLFFSYRMASELFSCLVTKRIPYMHTEGQGYVFFVSLLVQSCSSIA